MFRALILDWSGTLVDDMGPTLAATNAVLERFDKPPLSKEEFRESFRLPYTEFYEEVLPGVPIEELEDHFRRAFEDCGHPVIPLEGTAEFLAWCAANGIRLFVLTSMDPGNFHEQLRGFGFEKYFEETYAGVLDKRLVIGEILRTHGLRLEDTAYVGDMRHDIETARHGGVTPVGVLSGYDPHPQLAEAGPDLLLSCVKSLHAIMERWNTASAGSVQTAAPDLIRIHRLRVTAHIGVPDEERAAPQDLWISLAMVPALAFAGMQDEIHRTTDYEAVANRVREEAGRQPRRLIETLGDDVARLILREFPVMEVDVTVEKHILPDTEAVTVRTRLVRG